MDFRYTEPVVRRYSSEQLLLTLSWRRPISHRNQSIDLLRKSMDWFLYDIRLRHKSVKNFAMLDFLSNRVAGLHAWNFMKKSLQHRCLSVKFAKSWRASLLQNTSGGCFWEYLMNSLFIVDENDEWCHCVARIDSPALVSFYCVCVVSFYCFLAFIFLWILLLASVLR